MRKLLIALVALALAGCATIQNPLNITRLAQVESTYGIALSAANAYRTLYQVNRCKKGQLEAYNNVCARRSVVLQLQAADRKAKIALDAARAFVVNNPTVDAGSLIAAAQLAVDAFQKIEADNGVH